MKAPLDQLAQQARQALRAGRANEAERLAGEILAKKPRHTDALMILGRVALDRTQYDLAESWFRRAMTTDRRSALPPCRLGVALLSKGDLSGALAAYERALKLDPALSDALTGKADALERLGRSDRAEQTLKPWFDRGAATPHMHMIRVRLLAGTGRHEEAAVCADEALAQRDVSGGARRAILLIAGRVHERLGDHDRAFTCYSEGNAISAPTFDRRAHCRRHEALREFFTPERFETLPRSNDASVLPVLVFGLPRSGTTLVEQIIHAHGAGAGAGECHDFEHARHLLVNRFRKRGAAWPGGLVNAPADVLTAIARSYVERLHAVDRRAKRVVDKSLENAEHVPFARLIIPGARLVHVRRRPEDVCLAIWTENLSPTLHPYANRLEDVGAYYRAYEELMEAWRDLAGDHFLELDYESVVADPEAESRRLIDFIGLPWDNACLRPHEAKREVATLSYRQVREPIHATSVGRAARFGARLDPLREALTGKTP